jgi:hypothetical protein
MLFGGKFNCTGKLRHFVKYNFIIAVLEAIHNLQTTKIKEAETV